MWPFLAGVYRGPYVAHKLGWLVQFTQREPEAIDEMAARWRFYWRFFREVDKAELEKNAALLQALLS